MNYASRLSRLRRAVKTHKCDAFVTNSLKNLRYLCGFTGTAGMAVVTPKAAYFLTDFRYQQQAMAQVPEEFVVLISKVALWQEAAQLLDGNATRIAFEAEHTSVAAWQENKGYFPSAELIPTVGLIEGLRLQKDDDEIKILRRAIKVADEAVKHVFGILRPGLTEREVEAELLHQIKSRGASGPSFEFIVASGVRGALPHGVASDKVLEAGDMVTIDMGAKVDGYCSDLTRTVCLGKPTKEQQNIYEIVWRAQTEAAAQMRPGQSCKAADKVARDIITEAGYGEYFGHGLGHGVGLQIHEAPRVSARSKEKLKAGNVVSCEPGIYIPDWGGVRIEDLVLITPEGNQILSKAPKPRKMLAL